MLYCIGTKRISRMGNSARKLAVLIDAENTSEKIARALFEEIARLGEPSIRRIYGDFSGTRHKGWADILHTYGIIPQQQFPQALGKNASDISLVIDAMDLLHTRRLDGFCIVSSDSDFTRLAARIREQGLAVYGFGSKTTPESFRQACHGFILTDLPRSPVPDAKPLAAQTQAGKNPEDAVPLLLKALQQLKDADGWARMGTMGTYLSSMTPGFDPRRYGYARLSTLVRGTNRFELDQANSRLRLRTTTKAS
jgi:hypothetical protein